MNKLRNRLTLIYVSLVGISLVILAVFLTGLIERTYVDAVGQRLVKEGNFIVNQISREISNPLKREQVNQYVKMVGDELKIRITIIDTKGTVLADSNYDYEEMENHKNRPEIKEALLGKTGKEIRYSKTLGIEMLYIAIPVYDDQGVNQVIRLSMPSEEISRSLETIWLSLVIGLLILFLLIFVITNRVAHKITRPIERITEVAKKITKGDYKARADIRNHDEIGQLGIAINQMAESLKSQIETIHENERKLSTVLNNMASGVLLVDKDGVIKLANPAIEWLLGDSIEQLYGKYHIEAGQNYVLSELIERALKTGESIHTEIEIFFPAERFLDSNLAPIINSDGEINGVVAVLHDITRLKRLENIRTEFVANVSHELRTPITAVKGFTETLLDGALKDEELSRQFLEIIDKESDRLHRLINDLLDLSKLELNQDILEYSPVQLKPLIKNVIDTFKPQAIKKGLIIEEDLKEVSAEVDEDRIRQVIINLITNAIAYTQNGKISVSLTNYNHQYVKITIEDTGIGIPKKSIPRIFERFYRVDKARSRESGGTGLGLAIVKHIVESHEGHIQIESVVGKGSKFTIIIPKKERTKINM